MKKSTLQILFLTIMILVSCKDSTTLKSGKILAEDYIPKNLEEALHQINLYVSDSLKTEIKKKSENDFLAETHFGLGIGMRNNWKLWKGSDLSKYFNGIGIFHPDDMSGIILTSYYRKLTGLDIKLENQILKYKEYWKKVKLVQLPEKSEYPEPNLEFKVSIFYGFHTSKNRPAQVFIQTNSTNNNFWIYDYFYGWKNIDLKTKENLERDKIQNTESNLNRIFGIKNTLPNNS